jgi:hypothetical protein
VAERGPARPVEGRKQGRAGLRPVGSSVGAMVEMPAATTGSCYTSGLKLTASDN